MTPDLNHLPDQDLIQTYLLITGGLDVKEREKMIRTLLENAEHIPTLDLDWTNEWIKNNQMPEDGVEIVAWYQLRRKEPNAVVERYYGSFSNRMSLEKHYLETQYGLKSADSLPSQLFNHDYIAKEMDQKYYIIEFPEDYGDGLFCHVFTRLQAS